MTELNFKCAKCGEIIKADDRDVGKEGACPACGEKVRIPGPGSSETPPSVPPSTAVPVALAAPTAPGVARRPVRETSGFAIASLVCGILSLPGFMCGGFILAIIGLALSLTARSRIRNEPERWEGDGLAIAGLVTSIGGLALAVLALLIFGGMLLATGGLFAALAKAMGTVPPH